jgi:hypothetical protein
MESWYKVMLSDNDIIGGRGLELQDEFMSAFGMDRHSRKDALMLSSDKHYPGIEYVFSPGAVRIAREIIVRWGGKECPPLESPTGWTRLVGSYEALQAIFFPGQGKS